MEDAGREIVVGFDGSAGAAEALRWAVAEGDLRRRPVRAVGSWHDPALSDPVWIDELDDPGAFERKAEAEMRAEMGIVLGPDRAAAVGTHVVARAPAHVLVEASADAEVLVVGSRGRGGFATLLLGSVSRAVAGRAQCPVVVVRAGPQGRDVVVGVDGSAESRAALHWAAREALLRGARLRAVLAWSYLLQVGPEGEVPFHPGYRDTNARGALHDIVVDVLGPEPDVQVVEEAVCDHPAKALLDAGADAALLVVGPRSTSLRSRLELGSITDQLLHHAPCPLAIVHGG